jgi:hypothetical protein
MNIPFLTRAHPVDNYVFSLTAWGYLGIASMGNVDGVLPF